MWKRNRKRYPGRGQRTYTPREAWQCEGVQPVTINGRRYTDLYKFMRPCKTCGAAFAIYVTEPVARGEADTNRFGLINCEAHRRPMRKRTEPPTPFVWPWEK